MNKRINLKTAAMTALVIAAAAAQNSAIAQTAGTAGGLDTANTTATNIKIGLYTLLGTGAIIYMIYHAAMALTEKNTWSDFGGAVVKVAAAGGCTALASWAWAMYAS